MGLGEALANWKCECGRTASIEHPFGGYCKAKEIIKELEAKLAIYEEALKEIAKYDGGYMKLCGRIAKSVLKSGKHD